MRFADIPGLSNIKEKLIQSVKNDHVAHAQLFLGNEGSGNLALALAFSTYLNCTDKKETDSCGVCPSCTKADKFIHPDIHFIFPTSLSPKEEEKAENKKEVLTKWRSFLASNVFGSPNDWGETLEVNNKQLTIGVAESRNLIQTLSLMSFESKYKIAIIWNAEYMNGNAANALLKLLEEPPQNTIFLQTATNIDRILVTILSRSQLITIPNFSDEEVKNYLMDSESIGEDKASQAARLSEGNMRLAYSIATGIEDDNQQLFRDWMIFCFKNDYKGLVNFAEQVGAKGRESQKNLLKYALNIFRESIIMSVGSESILKITEKDKEFLSKFSRFINKNNIYPLSEILSESIYHIERNANPKIVFLDSGLSISQQFGA